MRRLIVVVVAACALAPASSAQEQPVELLPDLDQAPPSHLLVKRLSVNGRMHLRLGFASATENRGAGPLTVHGFRPDRRKNRMQVDQLIRREGAAPRVLRGIGAMRYVVNPDHRHWHLLGFAQYALRPAGRRRGVVRRDRKTGFCLGDRYRVRNAKSLSGFRPFPAQGDTCGLGRPGLTGLFAGISVGYGDAYAAQLEGQYIDITNAPSGRYWLIHTANPDRSLAESSYENNSASLLISLRRGGPSGPVVRVIRRCPDTELCRGGKPQARKHTPTQGGTNEPALSSRTRSSSQWTLGFCPVSGAGRGRQQAAL